jgi:hypothetical protein
MQAIGLVTGDEFLVQFNLTIDTEDVLDYIKNLTWDWTDPYKYVNNNDFDDDFGIDFAAIVGPLGICYNFNMVEAVDLFYLEKYDVNQYPLEYYTSIFYGALQKQFQTSFLIFRFT